MRPELLAVASVGSAFLVGVGMARGPSFGLALVIALCWLPLVLLNLPLGIVLWLPLVFLHDIASLRFGPQLAGLIILFAWFGTLLSRESPARALLSRQRRYLLAVAGFILWLTLSAAWSGRSALGGDFWIAWLQAGLIFLVVSTALSNTRHLSMIAGAFVFGAVVAVMIGLASTGLTTSETALETAAEEGGRLVGGSGDPNELAAGIIPAIVLAAGIAIPSRRVLVRLGAAVAITVLTVGFAATQSRGGLVASVVTVAAAFVVFKRGRVAVLALILLIVGVGSAWFSVNPSAWDRISSFDASGTGRTELWDVAWQMGGDHPIVGVGLDNFVEEAPAYADEVGPLQSAQFIAETPHVAHNTYFQLFAESGVIGLGLFLLVVGACLRACWMAAREFDLAGRTSLAILSRSVLVATIAALSASFFLSNGHDRRTWILLALAPALAAAARREAQKEAPVGAPSVDYIGKPAGAGGI